MIKRFYLGILIALTLFCLTSHTVIQNPKHGFTNTSIIHLTEVELLDTTTILHFYVNYTPGWWINLDEKYYIRPLESDEKLFVYASEGIPFNQRFTMPESGVVSFKAYFPPLDSVVTRIDFGAEGLERAWAIYDIELDSEGKPEWMEKLGGNWYDPSSGNWELGIYNDQIIFQQKLWSITDVCIDQEVNRIKINSGDNERTLFVQINEDGVLRAGFSAFSIQRYLRKEELVVANFHPDDELFELPLFNLDTVSFMGILKDYSPRFGYSIFSIHVNNILTGEQESYSTTISPDGTFEIAFPLYHPLEVFLRSDFYNGSILLEPGKDVFIMFDLSSRDERILYMGDNARLNRELSGFRVKQNYNYREAESKILDMSPMDFRAYCDSVKEVARQLFEEYKQEKNHSAKAIQIRELDFLYGYISSSLEYHWIYERAYRQKHNIPRSQRDLPVDIPVAEMEFYDFMTDEILNNPLAVMSNGFNSFVNRIKHNHILNQSDGHDIYTQARVMQLLKDAGHEFSDDELGLIDKMIEFEKMTKDSGTISDSQEELQQFMTKYQEYIEKFAAQSKDSHNVDIVAFYNYLTEQDVVLTPEENALMTQIEESRNSDMVKEMTNAWKQLDEFYATYKDLVPEAIAYHQHVRRLTHLDSLFGIGAGFLTDIMYSQDISGRIVSEMTPMDEAGIERFEANVFKPFIREYLALSNQSVKKRIESNQLRTGYTVHEMPDADPENMFEAILSKYKGKVVYVDFWATWCGPCRSGNTRIAPLKDELSDEDVVFVYITNPSSPENTWKNMIAEIKGEHYRVCNEVWAAFRERFEITGIPHYVLVDRNGEVVNPKVGMGLSNSDLKNLFITYLN